MKQLGFCLTIIAAAGLLGSCSTIKPVKQFVTNSASAVKEVFVPSEKEKTEIADRVSQKFDSGKQAVSDTAQKVAEATTQTFDKATAATTEAADVTADKTKEESLKVVAETKEIAADTKHAVEDLVSEVKKETRPSGEIVNEIYDTATNAKDKVVDSVEHPAAADEETPANAIVALDRIKGEWVIMSVYGEDITDDDRPYITFDKKTGRFYGSNGCNIINGDLVSDSDNSIGFENMIATMRACPDVPQQYTINMALPQVKTFKLTDEGQETYMTLYNESGHKVMTLRRNNMEYLNGPWTVTMLNGKSVEPGKIVMNIDLPELRVHGNAGCILFNGELFLDPDKSCSLQFGRMASTRMTCPDIATETEFLIALESVEECHRAAGAEGAISLTNSDGEEMMELIPVKVERE